MCDRIVCYIYNCQSGMLFLKPNPASVMLACLNEFLPV